MATQDNEDSRLAASSGSRWASWTRRRPPTCAGALAAEGRDADAELAALAASNREILAALPGRDDRGRGAARGAPRRAGARAPWLRRRCRWRSRRCAALVLRRAARPAPRRPAAVDRSRPEHKGIKAPQPRSTSTATAPSGDQQLADGAPRGARRSAAARLRARATGGYGALLSHRRRGQVTLHLPEGGARRSPLR